MIHSRTIGSISATAAFLVASLAQAAAMDLPRVQQTLVAPPFVPEHQQAVTDGPKIIEVKMVIEEKQIEVEKGVFVNAMTFNGTVPGPMIVAHEGDYIELTLVNPASNKFLHNIDFHASTGALGGGELTKVNPGETVVLRWKAVKAGVFVYHCAPGGMMIPLHVVSGMSGAVMVLPRDGLKDNTGKPVTYDRAYYIGEQDFYLKKGTDGKYLQHDSAGAALTSTLEQMRTLTPSHIVFNGSVGALTGANAMKASVGETVLMIHSQANRDSRPHLIGGHGDLVWAGGSFSDTPMTAQETWFVPGGSAVAALYTFRQPGLYAYVNHNLIEAILFGAAAHFQVDGAWDDDLMTQVRAPWKE